jgi:SsrA-binding protein
MTQSNDAPGQKQIARNRKAWHEYSVLDRLEAGIVLVGTEVKSLRAGRVNFLDAFVTIKDHEAWLVKLHISPYDFGNRENHDPLRRRKLLLHDYEILKLEQKINEKGLTIIPLALYFSRGRVKVDLGLCKGKKLYDKRETIAKRDNLRDMERSFKGR